jgi:hypothetical protein
MATDIDTLIREIRSLPQRTTREFVDCVVAERWDQVALLLRQGANRTFTRELVEANRVDHATLDSRNWRDLVLGRLTFRLNDNYHFTALRGVIHAHPDNGRIVFGIGINSDAAILGNIIISDQSFEPYEAFTLFPATRGDLFDSLSDESFQCLFDPVSFCVSALGSDLAGIPDR